MKALIVDDRVENRNLAQGILKPYFECDMAGNGEEAMLLFTDAMMEDASYDLVLLDIMMPGISGQEVLKKMRALEQGHRDKMMRDTVIFMVTALDSPREVLDAFFKGSCTDYLPKPIKREVLLKKVQEYVPGDYPPQQWEERDLETS